MVRRGAMMDILIEGYNLSCEMDQMVKGILTT